MCNNGYKGRQTDSEEFPTSVIFGTKVIHHTRVMEANREKVSKRKHHILLNLPIRSHAYLYKIVNRWNRYVINNLVVPVLAKIKVQMSSTKPPFAPVTYDTTVPRLTY